MWSITDSLKKKRKEKDGRFLCFLEGREYIFIYIYIYVRVKAKAAERGTQRYAKRYAEVGGGGEKAKDETVVQGAEFNQESSALTADRRQLCSGEREDRRVQSPR